MEDTTHYVGAERLRAEDKNDMHGCSGQYLDVIQGAIYLLSRFSATIENEVQQQRMSVPEWVNPSLVPDQSAVPVAHGGDGASATNPTDINFLNFTPTANDRVQGHETVPVDASVPSAAALEQMYNAGEAPEPPELIPAISAAVDIDRINDPVMRAATYSEFGDVLGPMGGLSDEQ